MGEKIIGKYDGCEERWVGLDSVKVVVCELPAYIRLH